MSRRSTNTRFWSPSLDETTEAFGQLYRDRGDGENIFDEMKNQWC